MRDSSISHQLYPQNRPRWCYIHIWASPDLRHVTWPMSDQSPLRIFTTWPTRLSHDMSLDPRVPRDMSRDHVWSISIQDFYHVTMTSYHVSPCRLKAQWKALPRARHVVVKRQVTCPSRYTWHVPRDHGWQISIQNPYHVTITSY